MAPEPAAGDPTRTVLGRRERLLDDGPARVVAFEGTNDGVFTWLSQDIPEAIGWTPEDMLGTPFRDYVHPGDVESVVLVQKGLLAGHAATFEVRIRTRSGGYRWTGVTVGPILDAEGVVVGREGLWRDVHGEREARLAQEVAEHSLTRSLEALQEAFFIFAAVRDDTGAIVDLRYEYLNAAAERMYGRDAAEVIGHGLVEQFPTVVDLGIFACYTTPFTTGEASSMRVPAFDDNGVVGAFDVMSSPFGERVVVTARDVTAEVVALRHLAQSEERYRLLAENAADFVLLFNPDLRVEWASPSVVLTLGWPADDLIGVSAYDLVSLESVEQTTALATATLGGQASSGRRRMRCADGTLRWCDRTVRPIVDDRGVVTSIVAAYRDVQEQVAMENSVTESRRMFQLIAEHASDVVWQLDTEGVVTWVSPSITHVLGWPPESFVGLRPRDLIHPDDHHELFDDGPAAFFEIGSVSHRARFRTHEGSYRWMDVHAHVTRDPHGNPDGSVGGLRDVHAEALAEAANQVSQALFRTAMESAAIGMALADTDRHFLLVNPALCRLLGYDEAWFLAHRLSDVVHPEDRDKVMAQGTTMIQDEGGQVVDDVRVIRSDGRVLWVRRAAAFVGGTDTTPPMLMLQIEDVTAERDAREALAYQAFHDPLTGLRNRAWILDILEVDLRTAKRRGSTLGVLFVDLDNFKLVNDSLGHVAGDEVLVAVADRISGAMRPGDRVGRFGGDEFVVVVPDAADPHELETVAHRLLSTLSVDLVVQDHRIVPTASIGIAVSGPESTSESLLRDTDSALFRAKRAGRAQWQFFDDAMHAQAVTRLTIEDELRDALLRNELVVHYQPIVSLSDRSVVGHEALVRWEHPVRGLLGPASFLDVAEESGLITAVGARVRSLVCRRLAAGGLVGTVALNVSAVELAQPGWLESFADDLDRYDVDASRLVVEVTETAVLTLMDSTRDDLAAVRSLGAALHVDDFGTGFSSISLLRDLPVSGLKLDRRFVADLTPDDSPANALSLGLSGLVAGLDLVGIAEGVETVEQAEMLRAHGWRLGQGYLFGRPAPLR